MGETTKGTQREESELELFLNLNLMAHGSVATAGRATNGVLN